MANINLGWKPSLRNITYTDKPEFVNDDVYAEAKAAKMHYNQKWDFWVWQVSLEYNVSQEQAEVACIKGIKQEILRQYLVYGDKVGKWYEEFLDMDSVFKSIRMPEWQKKLGE